MFQRRASCWSEVNHGHEVKEGEGLYTWAWVGLQSGLPAQMPPKRKKKRKSKKKKPSGNRTIAQALLQPSRQLAVLLGSSAALTRGEAVSGLWSYARARALNDGRGMRCDAAMQSAFGVRSMTMFEVSGHLSGHLTSTGSSAAAAAPPAAAGQRTERPAKRPRAGADRPARPPESGAVAAERRPKPQGPVVCSALLTAVLCGGSGPVYARYATLNTCSLPLIFRIQNQSVRVVNRDQRQLTLPSVATVTARLQNYITAHTLRVPRSNSVVRALRQLSRLSPLCLILACLRPN